MEYPVSLTREVNGPRAATKKAETSIHACTPCSQQKKRCDRILPICGSCIQKVRKCYYPVPEDQIDSALIKSLYYRIEQLKSIISQKSTVPISVDDGVNYPIPRRWYFSTLLSYRNAALSPLANQYPNSIAFMLQTSWMQAAWCDACLFHVTLYSTSGFIDITQGTSENPVTTYHKTETVRLIREAISNSDHSIISTSVVAATLHLLYFAKLKGEFTEGMTHESGIDALLRYKGMGTPQPDNIIGYFLIIQRVWNALVFRFETVFHLPYDDPSYNPNYPSILSYAAQKQKTKPASLRLPQSIIELIDALSRHSLMNIIDPISSWSDFITSTAYQRYLNTADSKPSPVEKCCLLAAAIYLRAMGNVETSTDLNSDPETQNDILNLKDEVTHCDEPFLLKCGPEVFRWVLMTGAAAAGSQSQRAWFVARLCPFCIVMKPEEVDSFLAGSDHFVWLFNYKYLR